MIITIFNYIVGHITTLLKIWSSVSKRKWQRIMLSITDIISCFGYILGAGEITPKIKHLLYKHEDMGSNPSTHKETGGCGTHLLF